MKNKGISPEKQKKVSIKNMSNYLIILVTLPMEVVMFFDVLHKIFIFAA